MDDFDSETRSFAYGVQSSGSSGDHSRKDFPKAMGSRSDRR